MNIIVVVVYWPFLHHLAVEYIITHEDNIEPKLHYMRLVHIFPAIANVLVLSTTNIRFATYHWKALIPLSLIYSIVNFTATKVRGEPLYPIFHWRDITTPLLVIVMTAGFAVFYILLANLTIWLNHPKP